MTDTPNTSRPSEAALEIAESLFTNGSGSKAERLVLWQDTTQRDLGGWCRAAVADRIDAALARAREEARREALEEGWREGRRAAQQALVAVDYKGQSGAEVWCRCHESIRALLTHTPQGESRVDQKRPPHPEELVNALQDRVHPASGPLIQSKPVTPQGETKEQQP